MVVLSVDLKCRVETGNSSISYLIQAQRSSGAGGLFDSFAVHSLNVRLIERRQLLALQFECVRHQTSLWGPRIRAQTDLYWDFKLLQVCCEKKHF